MNRALLLLSACTMLACSQSTSSSTAIGGKWWMGQLFDGTIDVTSQHNPALNRWIDFRPDGTYVSGGEPYGDNSGKWSFIQQNEQKVLFFDSDAGEGDDSYWLISIDGESMRWKGTNSDFTERFTVYHQREQATAE